MSAPFIRDSDRYRSRILLRPQEISNHPEVVRRLGILALKTALALDTYGNVNSTHVGGTLAFCCPSLWRIPSAS